MVFSRLADTWRQRWLLEKLVEANVRIAIGQIPMTGVGGLPVHEVLFNGQRLHRLGRPLFVCPRCERGCRHIYIEGFSCRVCCRLDWSSRHLHRVRWLRGVRRIVGLREKLGVDVHPFGPIPWRSHRRHRQHAIIKEIRTLERQVARWPGWHQCRPQMPGARPGTLERRCII